MKQETLQLIDKNNVNFKDLLSICIGKVQANQEKIVDYIGEYNHWYVDGNTGILQLDDKQISFEFIGTIALNMDNFWYSADVEKNIPATSYELIKKTKKLMSDIGLEKLAQSKIELNEKEGITGENLAMIYIAFSQEKVGYFCGNMGPNAYMYLFMKYLPSKIYEPVNVSRFMFIVINLIMNKKLNLNHKLLVKAFLLENDCHYIELQDKIIGTFPDDSRIIIEFSGEKITHYSIEMKPTK